MSRIKHSNASETLKLKIELIDVRSPGEFQLDQPRIISLSGTVGNYYITNEIGEIYRWDVDSSVKFKIDREH